MNKHEMSTGLNHTMMVDWDHYYHKQTVSAKQSPLIAKSMLIGRVGIMFLSAGTGAWRIREAMNAMARSLDLTCSLSIGLRSIEYTCRTKEDTHSQVLELPTVGVNTNKLNDLEGFVAAFQEHCSECNIETFHAQLDAINVKPPLYTPFLSSLAAGFASAAFVFLLGGGYVEILGSFIGAFAGQWVRRHLLDKKITIVAWILVSVFVACASYNVVFRVLEAVFHVSSQHQVGYLGSILFIIPGFPFITGSVDFAKLYLRSGLEKILYAIFIIVIAALSAWMVSLVMNLTPGAFIPQQIPEALLLVLRLIASFIGVYGFSVLFNSSSNMALYAGIIGACANTLRLELVDFTGMPASIAAFIGAIVAGLLASVINNNKKYPRISLTVPSIVIMIPGFYLYQSFYYIGIGALDDGMLWIARSFFILLSIPLGLVVARILTDREFRHCK